jgi:Putative auto-transporter adhesin, head GIN domain
MKYIFQFILLLSSFSVVAQKQFVVDEDAEVRNITDSFSSIKVSGGIHLYLSKGDNEQLAVSATKQKLKDGIKTEVIDAVLHISYSGSHISSLRNSKLNVYVAYKKLQQISASSASFVMITGITTLPTLSINMSSAAFLIANNIDIADLNLKCSGASDISLKGNVKHLQVECSGASDLNAYNLSSETCTVKASGASDVNITATKEITINASGASNVFYKGTAEVKEKNSSGASTISKRD